MAIGATIASKLWTDEFDIDIIAQLAFRPDADPEAVLDLLYRAIRGERGSRYYNRTTRRNRCVTVAYADGMHLDITPAVLLGHLLPKTSVIFHHKPETPEVADTACWPIPSASPTGSTGDAARPCFCQGLCGPRDELGIDRRDGSRGGDSGARPQGCSPEVEGRHRVATAEAGAERGLQYAPELAAAALGDDGQARRRCRQPDHHPDRRGFTPGATSACPDRRCASAAPGG